MSLQCLQVSLNESCEVSLAVHFRVAERHLESEFFHSQSLGVLVLKPEGILHKTEWKFLFTTIIYEKSF